MDCGTIVMNFFFEENFGCPRFEGNFVFLKTPIDH